MTWATKRTFLTMLTVLVTSITWGCSMYIAQSGVSGRGELSNPKTRAEVLEQFGKPDDTRTCPNGRVVESRWVRQAIRPKPTVNRSGLETAAFIIGYPYIWLDDIIATPVMAYKSEKAKLHYAFVYDEADRVLYVYDLATAPSVQFEEATKLLDSSLRFQLEEGKCDKWTVCITDYVQEVRRRAACLGYTLSALQEQAFERMFTIGEGVDSGRIPREDGLAEIKEVLYVPPPQ